MKSAYMQVMIDSGLDIPESIHGIWDPFAPILIGKGMSVFLNKENKLMITLPKEPDREELYNGQTRIFLNGVDVSSEYLNRADRTVEFKSSTATGGANSGVSVLTITVVTKGAYQMTDSWDNVHVSTYVVTSTLTIVL